MNRHHIILSKKTLLIVGAISFIALFRIFRSTSIFNNLSTQPSLTQSKRGIIHVVMFEFKENVTTEEIADVCTRMLALKDQCLHPSTHKPYVKMSVGGEQNSPEGLAGGITHAFISEFEKEEDRKYYLNEDPAHLAFVKSIGAVVKKAQVVDFTPGIF